MPRSHPRKLQQLEAGKVVASEKPHHEDERVIPAVIQWLKFQLLEQSGKSLQGGHVEVKLLLRVHRLRKKNKNVSVTPSRIGRITYGRRILKPAHNHLKDCLSMISILAKTNLSQAVQSGVTKGTELHTDWGAGGIIEPREEISERSEYAHQVHGHEFFDRINMLDERFDDGDKLGDKAKRQSHRRMRMGRTCSRKFEKVSDQSRSGAPPVEVMS